MHTNPLQSLSSYCGIVTCGACGAPMPSDSPRCLKCAQGNLHLVCQPSVTTSEPLIPPSYDGTAIVS